VILKKISVVKLFGVFDHDIPLNKTGITIVIGENGLGKTVILEATNAFFGRNFGFFRDLEFQRIIFTFDNQEAWEITKSKQEQGTFLMLNRITSTKESKSKPIKIAEMDSKESARNSRNTPDLDLRRRYDFFRYEVEIMERSQAAGLRWGELERDRVMHEMMRRDLLLDATNIDLPKWFVDALALVKVKLIETQRLITAKERGGELYINTVAKSSKELTEQISSIEKTASAISTELDSTYPNRLVRNLRSNTIEPFKELNDSLSKLDALRKRLSSLGLIESNQDSDLLQISGDQRELVGALKLYIEDSHNKLAPYDDISRRIQLFMAIVNTRFKHKTLEVNKKDGFVFKSKIKRNAAGNLETISPKKLSSGEQNELILFYELIFKSSPGDMILIDEPELSLHISWQNKFIDDLKAVTSINGVSVVIATHSPDIIDENWDLRVELLGVE
jgi:predicted ATP-binding protein involved in virulence